jgi:hypothetical protein
LLHHIEERGARLLHQHSSEQSAQGTDVAPQWRFFQCIGGAGRKFGKAYFLVL